MAIAASLVVRISTEYGSFVRGMKQAEKDLTRFGKSAQRTGRDLSTNLTLPIVAMGAVFFKAASDLERTENMFEATFGGMADAARTWSEQTASALTLSADDVRVTMARFNELASSMDLSGASALMMSKGLTQLTLDLMAYRNISEETASGALEAGLAGRMKGLRELGVVIKETDVKETAMRVGLLRTGQTMTAAQLSLASYITMTDALAKANGEMARAGDKPAVMLVKIKQQAGEVAQEMGKALMPAMAKVADLALSMAQHLKGMAEWFGKLPQPVRTATGAFAGLAAAIGPLLFGLGALALILPRLKVAGALLLTAFGNPVALAIIAAAAAFAVLATAMGRVANENERLNRTRGGGRGAGFGAQFENEADLVRTRLNMGFGARTLTPEQVEDRKIQAAIRDANRLAAAERALAEARAKMDPLRGVDKRVKDIAGGLADKGFGAAYKSIAGDVKSAVDTISKSTLMSVKALDGLKAAMASTKQGSIYWAQRMADDADLVRQKFEGMATSIEGSLTNLFSDVLMGQADAFKRFLDTITRMLADFAAQELVSRYFMPFLQQAALSFALPGAPNLGTGLMGNPLPAPSLSRSGGDSFHINVSFAPNFIDGRSGAAWLRENEGVITEAVISGVRKSGAARQALVGR